jgi:hypothetical protein
MGQREGEDGQSVCLTCSIINHRLFKSAHHCFLTVNLRGAPDPPFQEWCGKDHTDITQEELDALFGACYVTRQQAETLVHPDTLIICTHNEQVTAAS